MGYPHNNAKAICKECFYRNTVQKSKRIKSHLCTKFDTDCESALQNCSYATAAVVAAEQLQECEDFNNNFEHRFSNLDNCLGFHI